MIYTYYFMKEKKDSHFLINYKKISHSKKVAYCCPKHQDKIFAIFLASSTPR